MKHNFSLKYRPVVSNIFLYQGAVDQYRPLLRTVVPRRSLKDHYIYKIKHFLLLSESE